MPKPSPSLAVMFTVTVGAAACAQVTGLSDDYVFDRVGGSADAGSQDAALDARVEGGPLGCIASSTTELSSFKGTAVCKTCLVSSCCEDVSTCVADSACKTHLSCNLECTERPTNDRTQCLRTCTNGGVPTAYSAGVGACATRSCRSECNL